MRHTSISNIFLKEIISAAMIALVFQYFNFQYLWLFSSSNFNSLPDEEKVDAVKRNIEIYEPYNLAGNLFSIFLIIGALLKIIFNTFSSVSLPFDKWTNLDIATSLMNIVAFNLTG